MNIRLSRHDLIGALESVLKGVPLVAQVTTHLDVNAAGRQLDALVELTLRDGRALRWVLELRERPVEPYAAGLQALGLSEAVKAGAGHYAVVVAPFVSKRAAEILTRANVGFCDLSGNCWLSSEPLHIERVGFPNAYSRYAKQGSLFTPGAERVLRALLDPHHAERFWTLRELASHAFPSVSLGQAHKVVRLLEEQAFVLRDDRGLVLVEGEKLLGAWVAGYRFSRTREARYYSPFDGEELRAAFAKLVGKRRGPATPGLQASFTAAEVLAPHVRQHRFFAYWADNQGPLEETLQLKRVSSGENVVIYDPYDAGVLYPARQPDQLVTCPVQTYLDLSASAGRGEEAAKAVFFRWLQEAYIR